MKTTYIMILIIIVLGLWIYNNRIYLPKGHAACKSNATLAKYAADNSSILPRMYTCLGGVEDETR